MYDPTEDGRVANQDMMAGCVPQILMGTAAVLRNSFDPTRFWNISIIGDIVGIQHILPLDGNAARMCSDD